jgi:predicted ATPase
VIALNQLGRDDGAAMVQRLAGYAASLPPDVIAEIVERTDGVPLFVEEMTKALERRATRFTGIDEIHGLNDCSRVKIERRDPEDIVI